MASALAALALIAAVLLTYGVASWICYLLGYSSRKRYPPGPAPLPIIGNLLDMPKDYYWLTYSKWAKQYGDVVHVEVLGQHFIMLNTLEACLDLLDKRSATYSDRPRLPMMNECIGFSWSFALMQYGSYWRRHRKVFHQYFLPNAALKHTSLQIVEARKTMRLLHQQPEAFMEHIRRYFAASILGVTYGIKADNEEGKSFIDVSEKVMEGASIAGVPGSFFVDILPILKYVPSWFPGANFQKVAKYNDLMPTLLNGPMDYVKANMDRAEHQSIASEYIRHLTVTGANDEEEIISRNAFAQGFIAGADTTVSSLQIFFLAMQLYPDVQAKAHAQIDEVIGTDRLPEFSDMPNLPYIHAIVKELIRWQPVTPLAMPHKSTADDVYRGYHIPKGATILGNTWSILHDKKAYPDPEAFRPERFLSVDGTIDNNVLDPSAAAFGFGRRICPGRHFAINGSLILVASILAVFKVRPSPAVRSNQDEDQKLITSGLITHPLPFRCHIEMRSAKSVALLQKLSHKD